MFGKQQNIDACIWIEYATERRKERVQVEIIT